MPDIEWDDRPVTYRQRPTAVAAERIIPAEDELFGPGTPWSTPTPANSLNVTELETTTPRFGIVASGNYLRLGPPGAADLQLDDLHRAGLRMLRMG